MITAIKAAHRDKPCIYDCHVESAAAALSQSIRVLLANFRKLVKEVKTQDVARGRSTPDEWAKISRVLAIVELYPKEVIEVDAPQPSAPPIPNSWLNPAPPVSCPSMALVLATTPQAAAESDWAAMPKIDEFLLEFDSDDEVDSTMKAGTPKTCTMTSCIDMCFDASKTEGSQDPFASPDLLTALKAAPLPAEHHAISKTAKGKHKKQAKASTPTKEQKTPAKITKSEKPKTPSNAGLKLDRKNVHSRNYHKVKKHAINSLNMNDDEAKECNACAHTFASFVVHVILGAMLIWIDHNAAVWASSNMPPSLEIFHVKGTSLQTEHSVCVSTVE